MTVYCNYVWKVDADTEPRDLLTPFAREHFHAHEAVPIDTTQYGIDHGLNDVRAVFKSEQHWIAFCCRYQHDVVATEGKVLAFAQAHGLTVERMRK